MPELPEVETLRLELSDILIGKTIKEAKVLWTKTVLPLSVKNFQKNVVGQKITSLDRRAKMLLINLSNNKVLAFHLKMTGQLIFRPRHGDIIVGGHPTTDAETPGKHTRIIFTFSDGSNLYLNDLRKFGWCRVIDKSELDNLTNNLGPEPLSEIFTVKYLENLFTRFPNRTIKQIMLDQTLIGGIGNIYTDESAFLSGILPNRLAKNITPLEIKNLHKQIIVVLKLSIKHKGTSSRNYRRSNGEKGNFVNYLKVYGRAGQPCKDCKGLIVKIKHAGRGTHFCPKCQA